MSEDNLLTTDTAIRDLLKSVKRIAVLGIKTEAQAGQPSIEIPRYLVNAGFDVIPVPVYYPDVTTILERPVYHKLADIPGEIDLVDVFRRPQDLAAHVEDILAAHPRAVWFQSGIRHDAIAEQLAKAGILVVQDKCLMVELMGFGIRA